MPRIYINGRFLTQPTTGVQRYARDLCESLDELLETEPQHRDHELVILTPRRHVHDVPQLKWIQIRRVGRLGGHAWEQCELPWYSAGGLLFCPGNTTPLVSLGLRRKTVTTIHGMSFRTHPESYTLGFRLLYRAIVPLALKYGNAVLTASSTEKQRILRYYQYPTLSDRLQVVPHGCKGFENLPEQPALTKLHREEPYLLYVGSLNQTKNLQRVLQAVALVNRTHSVQLKIVGTGNKFLQETPLLIPKNLRKKVNVLGQIEEKQRLARLYHNAACFVFPSLYESFGLPPLEAMSCGCPVVVSNMPSMRSLCGPAALYCNPYDPQDIAQKIQMIIDCPAYADELGQRGRQRSSLFDCQKNAASHLDVMRRVLAA